MIQENYQNLINRQDIRKNLIEIKKAIREEDCKRALVYQTGGNFDLFIEFLGSEDAKTRKNAALILGELEDDELLPVLYNAYEKEEQLFVKSAYLVAMSNYDYREYLERLKERLESLMAKPAEETESKHVREESGILRDMILKYEKPKKHRFIAFHKPADIILTTNKHHKATVARQIPEDKITETAGGLRIQTKDLGNILPIRTYLELLFPVIADEDVAPEPALIADRLVEEDIVGMLENMHEGPAPFYFRLEIRSRMEMDKKASFAKRLSAAIEGKTDRKLINSTSNYEVEIRLVENKDGRFYVMLKLFTIKDKRFDYRKETVAASIHPVTAALVVELTKEFMKEDAQILDPFCGVGTMLIERNRAVSASPIYGIDSFGEAIEKARKNSMDENVIINYINRDFFDFRHEYQFDEIITNMPSKTGRMTDADLNHVYKNFFEKAEEVLADSGVIIMYSGEKNLVKKYLRLNRNMKLMREFLMDQRHDTYVFVIGMKG